MGASEHEIDFVLKGVQKVTLNRKGHHKFFDWLVPPDPATTRQLPWQRDGGRASKVGR